MKSTKSARGHRVGEVEAVDVGLVDPAFELVGDRRGRADEDRPHRPDPDEPRHLVRRPVAVRVGRREDLRPGDPPDFDSSLIGGSRELIDAVLAAPVLEIWEVDGEVSLREDTDGLNPVPDRPPAPGAP